MCEPTEAAAVKINIKGLVRCYENVNAHVKLFASDQEWIHYVFLNDIGLGLWGLCLPPEVVLPLSDLLKLVE